LSEINARVNQGAAEPSGDSAVYFTLSRLDGEGFISFQYIEATKTEKGKVLFKVTEDGESVLADSKRNSL
jgi:DNA-binding PadR family transcriptional regulator